jgi:hypothetical protein
MRLRDVIGNLESADDSLCIVAKRAWTPESEALLVQLTEDCRVPNDVLAQGYVYFLEVSLVLHEVLDGSKDHLTDEQRVEALIYYAENDAYPEWLCAQPGATEQ